MKKWAMVLNNYVIDIVENDTTPKYPPDKNGNPVKSIECDERVEIGMFYNNGIFEWENTIQMPPEPTQLDRIEEAVNKSQQEIIDAYTLELIEMEVL